MKPCRHITRQIFAIVLGAILIVPVHAADSANGAWNLPAGVRTAVQPAFPADARSAGHVDGHVVVAVTIDELGIVMDSVTLEASHPAFAAATELAVREWQFEPLTAPMQPRRELLQFEFRSDGTIAQLTHAASMAQQLAAPIRENAMRTVLWDTLPSPPQVLRNPMPQLAVTAASRSAGKVLTVSFVIDTQGRVRVPVVESATDSEVAAAVLDALARWEFSPSHEDGIAVLVQAQRSFGGTGSAP
jgi:TonB family protein